MWNRATTGLMAASALAGAGAWIDFLAILSLSAYGYQANAWWMALISALFVLPSMLLGPRIGRWLDLRPPLPVLLLALGLRTGSTLLLLLQPPLALFCGLIALRALFNTPTDAASNLLVSRFVTRDALPRYFSVLGMLRNASKIGAPVIGSAIASRFGESSALGLSIGLGLLALLIMATCLASPRKQSTTAARPIAEPAGPVADPGPASLPGLLLGTVTVFSFMVFLVNNQLPVLLHREGFDKALLGILVSCSGAGGILAAAWLSRRKRTSAPAADPMRATLSASALTAACFIGLGLAFLMPPGFAPVAAGLLFFCSGMCSSVQAIHSNVVVLQAFPQSVGQMTARLQSFQNGAMLVAPWTAALIIPHLSMASLFLLDGGLALLSLALLAQWAKRPLRPAPA